MALHSNYGPILYHFRDRVRYWSKIAIFSYPTCIRRPLQEAPSEYCRNVWCLKTRMVGPLNSEKKFENMFTRFNTHLSNIEPPALRKKAATDKLVEKIVKNDSWPIQPDILSPPLLRLTSRKPLWLDLQPVDIKSR